MQKVRAHTNTKPDGFTLVELLTPSLTRSMVERALAAPAEAGGSDGL